MSPETQKPEQMRVSPEQQAVADLSTMVTDALTAQGVATHTLEDGSQVRKVEVAPHFGPTLTETTAPDGTRSYEQTSLTQQSQDRGLVAVQWREGDNTVDCISDMEVAGKSSETFEDVAAIRGVQSDVEYVISKLPEKQRGQQRGRFGRALGRLAIRR